MGASYFLLKGKRKVDGEFALFATGYNLSRAENSSFQNATSPFSLSLVLSQDLLVLPALPDSTMEVIEKIEVVETKKKVVDEPAEMAEPYATEEENIFRLLVPFVCQRFYDLIPRTLFYLFHC